MHFLFDNIINKGLLMFLHAINKANIIRVHQNILRKTATQMTDTSLIGFLPCTPVIFTELYDLFTLQLI